MKTPKYVRITHFFIISKEVIYQKLDSTARQEVKILRQSLKNTDCLTKKEKIARFFIKDLRNLLPKLERNVEYKTKTHIKDFIKHTGAKYNVEIINETEANERILFECISFIGLKAFLKLFFTKGKRDCLYKQFYNITIKRK